MILESQDPPHTLVRLDITSPRSEAFADLFALRLHAMCVNLPHNDAERWEDLPDVWWHPDDAALEVLGKYCLTLAVGPCGSRTLNSTPNPMTIHPKP